MKVAILDSYFFHQTKEVQGKDRIVFGGAERYLVELCNLIKSLGHEVVVFQPLNQAITDEDGETKKAKCGQVRKEYKGIRFVCMPDTDDEWRYSTNPRLNQTFNEMSIHYDVVIYFATFLAYPHAVPNSISISHGIFWDYSAHPINAWGGEWKKEFFRQQLYGFIGPDVCVAVDNNVKRVISALSPGDEKRIRVISNFVDTEEFKPVEEKTWEETRVLYPRRLTTLRGCNDFIKASRRHPNYQYLAVGQSSVESLDNEAEAWGSLTKNIRFMHKEMDGMEELYQQSDIAVIPTRGCEGLSLSLLEAMSCGLPVITTHVGGIGDAVIHGYNALLYDPQNEDLGLLIDLMAKEPQMREVYGKRNREIARCFDIRIWQQKWASLLNHIG